MLVFFYLTVCNLMKMKIKKKQLELFPFIKYPFFVSMDFQLHKLNAVAVVVEEKNDRDININCLLN